MNLRLTIHGYFCNLKLYFYDIRIFNIYCISTIYNLRVVRFLSQHLHMQL